MLWAYVQFLLHAAIHQGGGDPASLRPSQSIAPEVDYTI